MYCILYILFMIDVSSNCILIVIKKLVLARVRLTAARCAPHTSCWAVSTVLYSTKLYTNLPNDSNLLLHYVCICYFVVWQNWFVWICMHRWHPSAPITYYTVFSFLCSTFELNLKPLEIDKVIKTISVENLHVEKIRVYIIKLFIRCIILYKLRHVNLSIKL